ncbi:MAG: PIN domain protein [Elusimicrobia bacterium]|nr:PIN domain protein [Elusimicrobiota bacterium]
MKQRIYIDTSVIGGFFDDEFAEDSAALFDEFRKGAMTAVVSDITLRELLDAPGPVQDLIDRLPDGSMELVRETAEATNLAECYVSSGAVSRNHSTDALHIAVATVERVHALVSWNFKHIVNLQRIRAYNGINIREGYPSLEIRSPKEVLDVQGEGS